MSLRIALVDDQSLVRAGLRALLERGGVTVAFEAEDGQALLDTLRARTAALKAEVGVSN